MCFLSAFLETLPNTQSLRSHLSLFRKENMVESIVPRAARYSYSEQKDTHSASKKT